MAGYQAYVAVGGRVHSPASGAIYDHEGVLRLADLCIRDVLEGDARNVDFELEHLDQLLRAGRDARQQANGAG